jgi:hypothetical protein
MQKSRGIGTPKGGSSAGGTSDATSIKCGYLRKESASGGWKRNWHQRWFVLDMQRGLLSYYKYESEFGKGECARGSVDLRHPDTKMKIDGAMAKKAPTPFSFQIWTGEKFFINICAVSHHARAPRTPACCRTHLISPAAHRTSVTTGWSGPTTSRR